MRLPSFLSNGSFPPLFALGLRLVVRAYPEILAGPCPLGFDTATAGSYEIVATHFSQYPKGLTIQISPRGWA
jgi:hypothetical protein